LADEKTILGKSKAGKNVRFLFFRFLGFNVRTVAGGTLDTGKRSRRPVYTKI